MFLVADINKRTLMKRLSQLQYRQICLSTQRQNITADMNSLKQGDALHNQKIGLYNNLCGSNGSRELYTLLTGVDKTFYQKNIASTAYSIDHSTQTATGKTVDRCDSTTSAAYQALQAADTALDLELDNLDSQIQLLNAQVETQQNLVSNNIKQDTTLWCLNN